MKLKNSLTSLIMLSMLAFAVPAFADDEIISVSVSRSCIMPGNGVTSVAIADPNVADVVISGNEIIVVGKKVGATSLHMWKGTQRYSYMVAVDNNDSATAVTVKNAIGYPNIDVTMLGGKVILEGVVDNQYERNRAEKIAGAFGEVVNMIEMVSPRQVRIECRIVDVNSNKSKNLGVSVGSNGSSSSSSSSDDDNISMGLFKIGQSQTNSIDKHHGGSPFHWFGSYANINAQLNAMITKGEARILSQPYIITMSGDKAEVFIGGQIAIPTSNDGDVTTEWKDYGIRLNIEPIVQNDGSVDSKIKTEVSSLDESTAVNQNGFSVPGILTRTADTHVMMKPGMTMAIGGLINSENGKSITKIPILGDIPIIGQFFRSTAHKKTQREIIILLTPILVDSDYEPVMSDEARRIAKLKDEEILRGDLHVQPEKK